MIFLDPRNDIAFKKIFGSDEHKNITISFLNSVLELRGERAIKSINFLNNSLPAIAPCIVKTAQPAKSDGCEQLPQRKDKKENILDIACFDQAGKKYIIELQVASDNTVNSFRN